uniref:TBC1 domain family member 4 n=1 Tax=Culex pipiens TaxID=7175 RepID=A0A8D8P5G6_CULPI
MAELMQQMRDPASIGTGGSVGSIPQSIVSSSGANSNDIHRALRGQGIHSTPASNLKLSEQMRHAQHDSSPIQNGASQANGQQQSATSAGGRISASKSFSGGLNHTASGGNIQASGSVSSSLSSLPDISANNSQFFEVLYVGKIKVSHKRVPFTFIDDALPKFKAYDAQKLKQQLDAARKTNGDEPSDQNSSETSSNGQPTQAGLNRISESNESQSVPAESEQDSISSSSNNSSPATSQADNKENTLPLAQAPDDAEVFRGRRVSHFDIPAKKVDSKEEDSNNDESTTSKNTNGCTKVDEYQRSVSLQQPQKDSKSSSDEE